MVEWKIMMKIVATKSFKVLYNFIVEVNFNYKRIKPEAKLKLIKGSFLYSLPRLLYCTVLCV